ncbi:hypothetical protein JXM67_03680 [candidate division WOR-3 bacterium]|nr:hypothetical protein [candidate division WOR-3 bacterium]
MKKTLVLAALILPVIAAAQLGGLVKTPKLDTDKVEDFVAETANFETKVDTAGDKLYSATDEFFAIVDSVTDLPTLTETWEGVKSDIKSAVTEEKQEAAEEGLVNYLKETGDRKNSFDELWQDNTVRTEIINHFTSEKESLEPIMNELQAALDMDKSALGMYDEIYKAGKDAVADLANQIKEAPLAAASGKKVLDEGNDALDTLTNTKEVAEQHVELATYILDKIKTVFQ